VQLDVFDQLERSGEGQSEELGRGRPRSGCVAACSEEEPVVQAGLKSDGSVVSVKGFYLDPS